MQVEIHCFQWFDCATCKTLFKVQDDLRHLKEQIISHGVSTEVIDLRTLESAIERTEQSVRVSNCL